MKIRYETLLPFYHWMWKHWRQQRWNRFIDEIQPKPGERLLDVGGNPTDWAGRQNQIPEVDLLNLTANVPLAGPNHPLMRCFAGDGRHMDFDNAEYDIVFSNSVIEHVGDLQDQFRFAREVCRVGKRLWIQTPSRACPVEPHYLGLFFHWLPGRWHTRLARWLSVVGLTRAANLQAIAASTRLISKSEFRSMFPDCRILTESFLGIFPKSYVAVRNTSLPSPPPHSPDPL